MKTAALLPTPGDPFLLKHWLRNYDQVWRGEVDELHVYVNMQPDIEVRAYLRALVESYGGIYYDRDTDLGWIGHGAALTLLVDSCDADIVVLCEDDCRVRLSGEVSQRMAHIAADGCDVISSPRGSMTPGIYEAAKARWGESIQADMGGGHGMWPAFVFARRDCLLATNRDYDATRWEDGEEVLGLGGYRSQGEECADTFGCCALQLRDQFRVEDDVQYKGPWLWADQLAMSHHIPWFHIGSLSSGRMLETEAVEFADDRRLTSFEELGEWGHRLYWWHRFLAHAGEDLPAQQVVYRRNLEVLQGRMGVEAPHMQQWASVCDQLVCWDEA